MLETALRKVVESLNRLSVPYALIGGLAVSARGAVRATKDVDLLIDWPLDRAPDLVRALEADGHNASFHKGDFDDPVAGVIRATSPDPAGSIKVDILFPSKRWQAETVARASAVDLGSAPIRVVEAADLFLLKLYAGGPLDTLRCCVPLRPAKRGGARALETKRRRNPTVESIRAVSEVPARTRG